MEHPVWSFVRGDDRLEISRVEVDDGIMLTVAGDGVPRSYFFRDGDRLVIFQRDMETLLTKTGWSFVNYSPDKRAGGDRRGWPRKANDRRRWWTDGASLPRQPKAPGVPADAPVREDVHALPAESAGTQPTGTSSK